MRPDLRDHDDHHRRHERQHAEGLAAERQRDLVRGQPQRDRSGERRVGRQPAARAHHHDGDGGHEHRVAEQDRAHGGGEQHPGRSNPSTGETSGAEGVRSSTVLTLPGSQRSASPAGQARRARCTSRPIGYRGRIGVCWLLLGFDWGHLRRAGRSPAGRGGLDRRCRACGRVRHRTQAGWRPPARRGDLVASWPAGGGCPHAGVGLPVGACWTGKAVVSGLGSASSPPWSAESLLGGAPSRERAFPALGRGSAVRRAGPARLLVGRAGRLGACPLRRHRAVPRGAVHTARRRLVGSTCGGPVG